MRKLPGAHPDKGGFACDKCPFRTSGLDKVSRSVMRAHIKAKHPEKPAEQERQ
jgi:hypothetical protein